MTTPSQIDVENTRKPAVKTSLVPRNHDAERAARGWEENRQEDGVARPLLRALLRALAAWPV
jgi:hypothetical protein